MKFADIALVVVGAGLGGGARYVIGDWFVGRYGAAFPWHTMLINVVGAFLLGILMAMTVDRTLVPSTMRLLLGVGFLGGFTTFSTLSYETVVLLAQGSWLPGLANMFGSGVAGILAAVAGLAVGRAL